MEPAYGLHTLASNANLRAEAFYPPDGTNGWRTACAGWQGAGSVPASGTGSVCTFTLTGPSIITWLWQEQTALPHASSPTGALSGITWHAAGSAASSLEAPEHHAAGAVELSFAGWEVDGARWPADGAPSPLQITGLPMPAPRTATARYLPSSRDLDGNGLPDWFEERYFGAIGQDRYGDPDGDGHENELEAADHTDPLDAGSFPVPPVILHDPLPSPALSPAPWPVEASITDNHRVAAATLHWQRNGGLLRSAPMTHAAGNLSPRLFPPPPATAMSSPIPSPHPTTPATPPSRPVWTVSVAYARIAVAPDSFNVSLPRDSQTNLSLSIQNTAGRDLELTWNSLRSDSPTT